MGQSLLNILSNFGVFAFLLIPLVGWFVNKAKEQRQIKRDRERIKKAQEEALRTGRSAEVSASVSQQPAGQPTRAEEQLRDLAERRRAQLEALRERQGQQGVAGSPSSGAQSPGRRSVPPVVVPGGGRASGGQPMPGRQSVPSRPRVPASSRPSAGSGQRGAPLAPRTVATRSGSGGRGSGGARPSSRGASLSRERRAGSGGAESRRLVRDDSIARSEGRVARLPVTPRKAEPYGVGIGRSSRPGVDLLIDPATGRPRGRRALANAIAVSEILAPPVSLRTQRQEL